MQALRKKLRSFRWLLWFALAFALFSYIVKPLKAAFWSHPDADRACPALQRGEKVVDRFGTELSYDARTGVARSAGADREWNTRDDESFGCQ